jgi:hypothetical protein
MDPPTSQPLMVGTTMSGGSRAVDDKGVSWFDASGFAGQ